ncbi:hypothetical protein CCC_04175 [Paramagnetospirillum magnetotacticum MS-1]|uniref:Uncharacterized protein n=1 Tax=Paramagnetospirillum magnetotacticum MS-1 TaxID=272627 RepID=A0A0C2YI29_PARME|nr:hypothetical protein CCC_04175 [Paramagnetospirillum magnetotacticum MS-1]
MQTDRTRDFRLGSFRHGVLQKNEADKSVSFDLYRQVCIMSTMETASPTRA